MREFKKDNRGSMLLFVMVFGAISFTLLVSGIVGYAILENSASAHKQNREMAFQIAEAGVSYYRWHLAHNKTDYTDGTGQPGPYIHTYEDKDGTIIGRYSLVVTPPLSGSTVVTIESTGWLDSQPQSKRIIRARVGFPALTDYAFLTNGDAWIGDTESVHGKFHANSGIRFDGTADAQITSAVPTYVCKEHQGCGNITKPGIWGDGTPQSYWSFPVPAKDFSAITDKLDDVYDGANAGGIYLSSSGKQGWRLQFTSDGKVKIYKVNTTNCYNGKDIDDNKYYSFCIDIKTLGTADTRNMPANGFIYVADNVWVDGVVNGRATVGTAIGKSIIINNNLTYLAKDGNHSLGLMAEKNVLIPHNSPSNLEINAVILAQNGAAKRYYYPGDTKDSLTVYGSIITGGLWTWSWSSGGGSIVSGYEVTNSTYDVNLTYGPPPGFPVGSEYNLISWEALN